MSDRPERIDPYPEPESFLRRYVFSIDHKMVGKQYLVLALLAVFIGIILSWLMRLHLGWPMAPIPGLQVVSPGGAPSGVITPEYYLSLMTIHGTVMVFFVLTTAPIAAFGNYFLPIQIGARNMAFPRLSMLSFWITALAFVVLISSFFIQDGPPISGWTAYPPLSAVGSAAGPGEALGQTLWLGSISIFCIAQVLSAVNFIATTLDLRAKGMTLGRMPITVWTWFVTSVMILLGFAVLLPSCLLLLLDRVAGTSFFVPAGLMISDQLQPHAGGTPLLWQHLFWFFGHPEVYIAILPTVGIVSLIFPTFARKPVLGPRIMIGCAIAIGALSFLVWGHHMFVSGMNPFSAIVFSVPTLLITVPSSILVLLWIGTLYGARLRFTTAGLFCLGFISVFITGGIAGFFLAQPSIDSYLHATYFVVAHFHFVMGVAAIFGIFAGTYFWFPKMFGRMMSESLGKWHFWLTFIGVYCIFMPMYFLGFAGNVRRYSYFTDDYLIPLIPVHKFITIAALLTGLVQFIFIFNLAWSRFRGRKATDNPWDATTLEWSISSPPGYHNFEERVVVHHGPDEYGVEESGCDYIMQAAAGGMKGVA
jgi:cytochrome c oxidase subunit 1